ncbi:MAG: LamG domain-containing protein, partial [Bacteroidetes bacterium]|nr:LamG domain-containing protein [Bacteroidota bacterium]
QTQSTTVVTNGLWHHVVWTTDGVTGHGKLYIDGIDNTSSDGGYSLATAAGTTLYIGGYAGSYFNGSIDDVAIYSRTLTPNEISALYFNSYPKELYSTPLYSDASLTNYWRMESNSNDSKGSVNGTDVAITYSTGNGKFGQGAGFNGTTSGIVTTTTPTSNSMSWSFWLNINSLSSVSIPMVQGDPAGPYKYFVIFTDGSVRFTNPGGHDFLTAAGVFSAATWQHIAITVGSTVTDVHIYVNGTEKAVTASGSGGFFSGNYGYYFGRSSDNGYRIQEAIDDIAVFSRVLTPAEINKLYYGLWHTAQGSSTNALFFAGD